MKKGNVLVAIIGIILIVLILLFVILASINDNTVLTIGKTKYDLEDYKSYAKVWSYEQNTTITDDADSLASYYAYYKAFYKWAVQAGASLSGDELPAELESGDAEVLLNDYELTEEEYMRVKNEMALAEKLMNNGYNYAKLPADALDVYRSYVDNNGLLSSSYYLNAKEKEQVKDYEYTVDYRVFEVNYSNYSGEIEAANAKEEVSGDELSHEDETTEEERVIPPEVTLNAKIKAQEIMASIKDDLSNGVSSDEAFSNAAATVDESHRYNLYTFTQVDNGAFTTMSKLYAKRLTNNVYFSYGIIPNQDYYEAISDACLKLSKGEFSDVIEYEDGVAFVYIEDVREGLEGDDLNSFRNEATAYYINASSEKVFNPIVAKKFSLDTLPINVRKAEEEANANIEVEPVEEEIESGEELLEEVPEEEIEVLSGEAE